MNRLRIKHMTGFHYGGDVTASYNEARMLPVSADGQLVLFSNLEILPMSSHHSYVDYWGSRVSSFEILTPHKELSLTATSLGEATAPPRGHEPHVGGAGGRRRADPGDGRAPQATQPKLLPRAQKSRPTGSTTRIIC